MTQEQAVRDLARKVFEMAKRVEFKPDGGLFFSPWFNRAVDAVVTEARIEGKVKATWQQTKFWFDVEVNARGMITEHLDLIKRKAMWGW